MKLETKMNLADKVIALVKDWQKQGRIGYCLPVIRGDFLNEIERAIYAHESTTGPASANLVQRQSS